MFPIVLLIIGLFGLWFSGEIIIPAAKRIARRLKISEVVIGLTVVSIGTSIPEISTNLTAGYSTLAGIDASGIAIGNIIGSNLSQITLVLGLVGFVTVMKISERSLKRDGLMMLFALILMMLASIDLRISRFEGIFLVSVYLIYLFFLLKEEKIFVTKKKIEKKPILLDLLVVVGGVVLVVYSADLVVSNGVNIARTFGIREALIGIFVGLGTTLPELTISLKAALQKAGGLSIGNLIGSNITDPLLSLGLGSSLAGFSVAKQTLIFVIPFWLVGTLIALLLLFNHVNLNRKESGVLILFYLLFLYIQFFIF